MAKRLRIHRFILLCLLFAFHSNAQILGRLPLQLVLRDDNQTNYTFTEEAPNGKLDLGRKMIKLTNLSEGHFIFEFHEPVRVRLKSKNSSAPMTKIMRELHITFSSLDFMSLTQVFESQSNSVVTFDVFDIDAEAYIDWYLSRNTTAGPPPLPRPKLYRVYGLHLTLSLNNFIRGGFISPEDAYATYREVIDPRGNVAPELEVKPLAFWEMRSMSDPLVHQILIIASGEREIDLPPSFPQNNDERGRILNFRKSCFGPLKGREDGDLKK